MIRKIIDQKPIETQEELAKELQKQGFKVTQATISRDIKELGLIKILKNNGKYCYAEPEGFSFLTDKFLRMLKESIISMDSAENLIVVKTLSGAASAAAEAIDNLPWNEILGTIAGDNTILIIAKSKDAVENIIRKFNEIIM